MNMLDYFSPASSEVSRKRVSLFAKMLNYCFNLKQQMEEQRAKLYWNDESVRLSVQQQIDKYRSKQLCGYRLEYVKTGFNTLKN